MPQPVNAKVKLLQREPGRCAELLQLGELMAVLSQRSAPLWLDSGSLLGMVRDGAPPSWDSDIDLGGWSRDLDRLLDAVRGEPTSIYRIRVLRYRHMPYEIALLPRRRGMLPVHIHLFDLAGGTAWSPQVLIIPDGTEGRLKVSNMTLTASRRALLALRRGAHHQRGSGGFEQRRSLSGAAALAGWTGFAAARRCLPRHRWARTWPFRALYRTFTWMVPAHHFQRLELLKVAGMELPVPGDIQDYLRLRYGDWRTPRRDWLYWADDGAIVQEAPEQALNKVKV